MRSTKIIGAVALVALAIVAVVAVTNRPERDDSVELVLDAGTDATAAIEIVAANDAPDACSTFEALCGAEIIAICRPPGVGELCVLAIDGDESRRLTEATNIGIVRISPDGRSVAYTDDGTDGTPLHTILDLAGARADAFVDGAPVLWKSDDELIITNGDGFAITDTSGVDIGYFDAPGTGTTLLRTMRPDGSALLATVGEQGGQTLWEYSFADESWRPISQGPDWLPLGAELGVSYSPDGSVAYTQVVTEESRRADTGPIIMNIVAIDLESLVVEVVASVTHDGSMSFALAPDGRTMAVRSDDSLVLLDVANGSTSNHLHIGPTAASPGLTWSPDSEHLVLDMFIDGKATLARIDEVEELHLQPPTLLGSQPTPEATDAHWVGE